MSKDQAFLGALAEYARFLSASGAPGANHWAGRLRDVSSGTDPVAMAREVLSFYGGMGSINDIVFPFGSADHEKDGRYRERLHSLAEAVAKGR